MRCVFLAQRKARIQCMARESIVGRTFYCLLEEAYL